MGAQLIEVEVCRWQGGAALGADVDAGRSIDDERLIARATRRTDPRHGATGGSVFLADTFRQIESYLNRLVDEYKDKRHIVAANPEGVALESFKQLPAFLHVAEFRRGIADRMDEVIKVLHEALLRRVEAPA
jgi:hypothetical protein